MSTDRDRRPDAVEIDSDADTLTGGPFDGDTMPTCDNCGSHVSADYVRVALPDEFDRPRYCPHCENYVREKSRWRESRT